MTLLDETANMLDAELSALLEGRLGALVELTQRAEALATRLEGGMALAEADRGAIAKLRQRAQQNQILLASARSGVRAAERRLAELREVARGLQTYDRGGQRTALGAPRACVERRR